jgi:hypothetical protein
MTTSKLIALSDKKCQPCVPNDIVAKKGGCSYTKDQKRLYNAYYREVVLAKKQKREYRIIPKVIPYWNMVAEELTGTERCCSTFGCGKKLSSQEALFGNTCIAHQQKKGQLDPTLHLKF